MSERIGFAAAVGLERRKLRRSRVWVAIGLVIGFELLWGAMLLIIGVSREGGPPHDTALLILRGGEIHTVFAAIVSAVVASRLAAVEHDARMMPLLAGAGQPRGGLFLAKLLIAFCFCSAVVPPLFAIVTGTGLVLGISLDAGLLALWCGGLLLANIPLIAVHLLLALTVRRQAITLGVGVVGAFIGSLKLFLPPQISAVLPWLYPAFLSPIFPVVQDGQIVALGVVADIGLRLTIVAVACVLYVAASRAIFMRTNLEG